MRTTARLQRQASNAPTPTLVRTLGERPFRRPSLLRLLGRAVVRALVAMVYRVVFRTRIEGSAHVPAKGGFLVAANHASHLDAGLIKTALGSRGQSLCALAAKDYFFAQAWSRWYFENFTNVLPFDRQGGFRASLKGALDILAKGVPLLIFPEGTRSTTGQMAPFKPAISSMALSGQAAILPIYLVGTHAALAKGKWWPRNRHIGARIGRPLTPAFLAALTLGRSRHEAYRRVTLALEETIVALGRGVWLTDAAIEAAVVRREQAAGATRTAAAAAPANSRQAACQGRA